MIIIKIVIMKTMITIMIRLKNRLTHFVGALSLHLSLALLALLVQHCALDLQVVDHPLPDHDGGGDHNDHDDHNDHNDQDSAVPYNIIIITYVSLTGTYSPSV